MHLCTQRAAPTEPAARWPEFDLWHDTSLHRAVMKGRTPAIQMLLQSGADVNTPGFYGLPPRLTALTHNRLAAAAALPATATLRVAPPDELAQRCYLAGVFGLRGMTRWQGRDVDLNNNLHEGVIANIAAALQLFLSGQAGLAPVWQRLADALQAAPGLLNCSDAELTARAQRGTWLALATGWRGHAAMHLVMAPYVIRVDRLAGNRAFALIHCPKAEQLHHVIHVARASRHQTALVAMVRLKVLERRYDAPDGLLRRALTSCHPRSLTPGMCSFGNTKALIRAALLAACPHAPQAARAQYKAFSGFLRHHALCTYVERHARDGGDAALVQRCRARAQARQGVDGMRFFA